MADDLTTLRAEYLYRYGDTHPVCWLVDRVQEDEAIFRWLLGEEGEFPESVPGKRYSFRSELRRRLAERATARTP